MGTNSPPPLPRDISSDGREIWEWGASLSEWTQRQARMGQLRADIRRLPNECGSCDHWMKSSQCPREVNVNGRNRGPSMKAPICGQFVMGAWQAELLDKLKSELAELSA